MNDKLLALLQDFRVNVSNDSNFYEYAILEEDFKELSEDLVKLFTLHFVSKRSELLKAQDEEVSFDAYVEKYYKKPKTEVTYVSKYNGKTITEKALIKQYMKAMCLL